MLAAPIALQCEPAGSSVNPLAADPGSHGGAGPSTQSAKSAKAARKAEVPLKPFSQFALGGGISLMGINLQAATNVNRYLNLRCAGNVFNYSVNNISTNGLVLNGSLNMATVGASLDYYPFPKHGLRVSPGVLFYNQNQVGVSVLATGGTSFKLNGDEYYSSSSSPVEGNASVGFNALNPAFTISTGWGNMIPRRRGRLSFPFEIGAAIVGSPSVNAALTQGQVCDASGENCVNVATDTTLTSDLQAQVAKYKNDLNPLKVYPIFSFGVAYSFGTR